MPRETTTMQCYPSDQEINRCISEMELFLWELISNQRCQEFTGQTSDSTGTTNHYSTFNKLTFSRDKDAKWYVKIVQLEREYKSVLQELKSIYAREPSKKECKPFKLLIALFLLCLYVAPGVIYIAFKIFQKKKIESEYREEHANWEVTSKPKIDQLNKELLRIEKAANAVFSE